MYQTFHINTDNLTTAFIKSVRSFFGHKEVKITVEEIATKPAISQPEFFKRMEQHRLKLRKIKVPADLNLSELANEVNDTEI